MHAPIPKYNLVYTAAEPFVFLVTPIFTLDYQEKTCTFRLWPGNQ